MVNFSKEKFIGRFFQIFLQVLADWQWYNYVDSGLPSGKEVLRIKMDETSICLWKRNVKGNLFLSKKRPAERRPVQRVARARMRTRLTHVAFSVRSDRDPTPAASGFGWQPARELMEQSASVRNHHPHVGAARRRQRATFAFALGGER